MRPGGGGSVVTKKWKYNSAGVYVFRTRRPGLLGRAPSVILWPALALAAGTLILVHLWWFAPALLMFSNRHFAYVGESMSVRSRRRDHLEGSVKYNQPAKPWTDLRPSWYYVALPPFRFVTLSVETLLICLLWPVYNSQKNLWNPRRIPIKAAKRQRGQRDYAGWSFNMRYGHVVMFVVILTVAAGQGWITWLFHRGG